MGEHCSQRPPRKIRETGSNHAHLSLCVRLEVLRSGVCTCWEELANVIYWHPFVIGAKQDCARGKETAAVAAAEESHCTCEVTAPEGAHLGHVSLCHCPTLAYIRASYKHPKVIMQGVYDTCLQMYIMHFQLYWLRIMDLFYLNTDIHIRSQGNLKLNQTKTGQR